MSSNISCDLNERMSTIISMTVRAATCRMVLGNPELDMTHWRGVKRTSQLWTTPCRCESPRVKFILVHAKLVDTFYFYIPWSWNTRQSPRARSALNSSARPFKLRVSTIHDSKIKLLEIFILWNSCLKFFKQIKHSALAHFSLSSFLEFLKFLNF